MSASLPAYQYPGRPSLLLQLHDASPEILEPEKYSTDKTEQLQEQYLLSVFDIFVIWARNNRKKLTSWVELHSMPWVRDGHTSRVGRQYVFPVDRLIEARPVNQVTAKLGVSVEGFLYAFDVVLRYPLYGMLAGDDNYYAAHPIRNAFKIPGTHLEPAPTPSICISFQKSVGAIAGKLTQDQYIKLLVDLRQVVRDQGLHVLSPGEVEEENIRDIAQKVALTPYLRGFSKSAGVAGGIVGGLGAIPVLGPASAILGGAIAATAAVWSGKLPRPVAKWKWLKWALRWQIQDEVAGG